MSETIKNIIIFLVVAVAMIAVYFFFIKKSPSDAPSLVSSSVGVVSSPLNSNSNPSISQDFLTLLLSVKNIKLNDAIFSENAFTSLHDSSITLIPDGTEGRVNPFAPLGSDTAITPTSTTTSTTTLTQPTP